MPHSVRRCSILLDIRVYLAYCNMALVVLSLPFHPQLHHLVADLNIVVSAELDVREADRSRVRALLLHGHARVTHEVLKRFPNLLVVSSVSVGVDHIDIAACSAAGVVVGHTPGVLDGATADMAWTLLLASARRLIEGHAICMDPSTTRFDPYFYATEVHGATIGIVGMGRVGQAIARRAAGFDMRVLYHNRRQLDAAIEAASGNATYCATLHELLEQADFVVLAAPATPETAGMMGAAQFGAMKRSAVFVNVARGSLVDQPALLQALQEGIIAAAGLDVTAPEPLPRDHPLLKAPNLTMSPHTGSATLSTRRAMLQLALTNLAAGLAGSCDLPHSVNGAEAADTRSKLTAAS